MQHIYYARINKIVLKVFAIWFILPLLQDVEYYLEYIWSWNNSLDSKTYPQIRLLSSCLEELSDRYDEVYSFLSLRGNHMDANEFKSFDSYHHIKYDSQESIIHFTYHLIYILVISNNISNSTTNRLCFITHHLNTTFI